MFEHLSFLNVGIALGYVGLVFIAFRRVVHDFARINRQHGRDSSIRPASHSSQTCTRTTGDTPAGS